MNPLEILQQANNLHKELETCQTSMLKYIFDNMVIAGITRKEISYVKRTSEIVFYSGFESLCLKMYMMQEGRYYGMYEHFDLLKIFKAIQKDGKVSYNDIINYKL